MTDSREPVTTSTVEPQLQREQLATGQKQPRPANASLPPDERRDGSEPKRLPDPILMNALRARTPELYPGHKPKSEGSWRVEDLSEQQLMWLGRS